MFITSTWEAPGGGGPSGGGGAGVARLPTVAGGAVAWVADAVGDAVRWDAVRWGAVSGAWWWCDVLMLGVALSGGG